jgi:hypothetical protein
MAASARHIYRLVSWPVAEPASVQSRLRLRNCSNDAGEFYEVINIGDAGHVISRAQALVECLAKSMIDALTSLDLWQIFPPRALHARIGLFLTNNNVICF